MKMLAKNISKLITLFSITTLALLNFSANFVKANEEVEPGMRGLETEEIQEGLYTDEDYIQPEYEERSSNSYAEAKVLKGGEIYFKGNYPDSFGHGVGMSQWGAYGAAAKGWTADQILTFYYTETAIETREDRNINVEGYGVMTIEDYVSDLGEVPAKACGTPDKIQAQEALPADHPLKEKYVQDNPATVWDCWPEEAIKAQVIAARSYAATSAQPICTTAACQVYSPQGKRKSWAAYETKGKYIISKGATANNEIIRAFYSANNNNGNGTADNDTVWSDKFGNATAYSYLRSVIDKDINYDVNMNRSSWSTNSYSIEELDAMLKWCAANCPSKDWVKTNIVDKIGTLKSISAVTDKSGRVKKLKLIGNLQSADVSGWFFSQIFNLWLEKAKPGNKTDEIPSLTFTINEVCPYNPIYRFWSQDRSKHFYTSNAAEKDGLILNNPENVWKYEGIAFCAPLTQVDGTEPIYRFWSPEKMSHFYTQNEQEKNNLIANDPTWQYEGITYYAFNKKTDTNTPVYRFWSTSKRTHFYTINEAEKNGLIANDPSWAYEGPAFYAVVN